MGQPGQGMVPGLSSLSTLRSLGAIVGGARMMREHAGRRAANGEQNKLMSYVNIRI
jgi:hypothetical protein